MRVATLIVLGCLLWPGYGHSEATYIFTNHRLDVVKLVPISKKDLAVKAPTHPVTIPVEKMSTLLASVKLSHKVLLRKEAESQEVFNERAIHFLAPKLVEAFAKVGPEEEVVFSYLFKDPTFIIRNDRYTAVKAWVHDQELHLEFLKLHAKLSGDYDRRGNFDKAVNRSRGIRIDLEVQPGQMLGSSNPEELVLPL